MMPRLPDNLWLEYRLDSIRFQNGEKIVFPASTRMLYGQDAHAILIEMTAPVKQRIVADLLAHNDRSAPLEELSAIYYAMLVWLPGGQVVELPFKHTQMQRGNGISLALVDGELMFHEQAGAPMFSKDYTLRDVSDGEIDSDRAVWQFHGYKHEH